MALPERHFETDQRTGETGERYPTFFGYSAYCIETAIREDSVNVMKACHDAGYANPQCISMDGYSLPRVADRKGAKKVAAWLRKNGYE